MTTFNNNLQTSIVPSSVRNEQINVATFDELEETKKAIKELQAWALPVNMIIQCDYCGTFAVRGFLCTQCGAPINLDTVSE